ncbi:MAG: glycoside hydrolase family 32 protein [Anaerolineae bacterium]|nr:glycoside hydrolase family 32 protein [Anaerolineae bacterium]
MTLNTPALTLRQQFAADIHRPRYHFLPPSNWMNDPNGLIQWQGQYHLFYQHNPFGPLWGNMHWGHAVSPDLIHWTDLPLALAPTPDSPDETGIFSGCAVRHGDVPIIFYTGTARPNYDTQTQCLATGSPDLLTWTKAPANPVLGQVPPEAGQTKDFRDPFVWQEGDTWYMVVGSRIQDVGGAVFLYRSTDLHHWDYLHPLLVGAAAVDGVIWECPNFFPLGDQWVLIISSHLGNATGTVLYFVGHYEQQQFTPTARGVLDHGRLYAPLTFVDDAQRRLLFGWLREARSNEDITAAGWAGVQSIPRRLWLDAQQRLCMAPVPELERLRGHRHSLPAQPLDGLTPLPVEGLALDVVASFDVDTDGQAGLCLAGTPDGSAYTAIQYDAATQTLAVERVSPQGRQVVMSAAHPLAAAEPLALRILLDGSVLEIIANDRTSLTDRVYVAGAECCRAWLSGARARLLHLHAWEMPSIWQWSQ